MGYRSDVVIAVAFENNEHRDEVWAVYCMDPRVQKHNLAGAWKNYDKGDYPVLWYHAEHVKWYDNYHDVQGIEHMIDVASSFAQERGKRYAALHYRIGEDLTDIETMNREADPTGAMGLLLSEFCAIERRIVHNFN